MVHDALYWGATYPDFGLVDIFWLLAGWIWLDPPRDTKHIELYFIGRLSCKLNGGGIGLTLKLLFFYFASLHAAGNASAAAINLMASPITKGINPAVKALPTLPRMNASQKTPQA